jgi:GNAT superfamily N-acetyltransferase
VAEVPADQNVSIGDRGQCNLKHVVLELWPEDFSSLYLLSNSIASGETISVTIRTRNGSCYALDLYEKYSGEGIGLALLKYALAEAKRRGFRKQVAYTHSSNAQMLGAAIHMFGFNTIAVVETRRLFSKPFSRWRMESPQSLLDINIR